MTGLYIHIPFCIKKCSYCDFVSFPCSDAALVSGYVDALCREALSKKRLLEAGISTLYIGGGTPSLLLPRDIDKLFTSLVSITGSLSPDCEITVEANPGTLNADKLAAFKYSGVNRISLGIQSFNNSLLSLLGRIHTSEDAVETYKSCRVAGFHNISMDLMFALPGQSYDMWKSDITKAAGLAPEHISAYNLQVEESTPLWHKKYPHHGLKTDSSLIFPDEETDAEMYIFSRDYLKQQGYINYEISNFARPGRESRHNIGYWKNNHYLGLGVAAHSHLPGRRFSNTEDLVRYISCPEEAAVEDIPVTPFQTTQETIFLGLRMAEGVPFEEFRNFRNEVRELLDSGLIEETPLGYRLTEQGVLIGNRVFSYFV